MNICYLTNIVHNDIAVCLQAKLIIRKEEKNKVMHILGRELPRELRHVHFLLVWKKNALHVNTLVFFCCSN